VNLRYDNQVIVNPDMEGKPRQPVLSASAAKAAAAAGVKPAALITHINPHDRTLPKPAFELTEKKIESASTKKPTPKARVRKTRAAKIASSKKGAAKASASSSKAATTAHAAARKPATKKQPMPAATAHPLIPKPSAAIAKQQPNASSD
jgi:hypothetical protein